MTQSNEFKSELFSIYYKKLFPTDVFYRWLTYGKPDSVTFTHREMSFVLTNDVFIRFLSFDTLEEFEKMLTEKIPEKIDIGPVYKTKPKNKTMISRMQVEERELIFDIDITDYAGARYCGCGDTDVCSKCWKLMSLATKILHEALTEDFGFQHILWVFSGRRGIHCWVCDEIARGMSNKVRSDVGDYLQVLSENSSKKLCRIFPDKVHPLILRSADIIREHFVSVSVEGLNILGDEGLNNFLMMLDDLLKREVEPVVKELKTSRERWDAFVSIYNTLFSTGKLNKKNKYLIEEIMLHYSYPRLDINVTKSANHLLKSPFCIHPKTEKICVPFNPGNVFAFNPETVPTISELIDEIQAYDQKKAENSQQAAVNMKMYKKTSLHKSMQIFEEFVRKLEADYRKKEKQDDPMEIM